MYSIICTVITTIHFDSLLSNPWETGERSEGNSHSRLMWFRAKADYEWWAAVSVYAPGKERSEDEWSAFWEELSEDWKM